MQQIFFAALKDFGDSDVKPGIFLLTCSPMEGGGGEGGGRPEASGYFLSSASSVVLLRLHPEQEKNNMISFDPINLPAHHSDSYQPSGRGRGRRVGGWRWAWLGGVLRVVADLEKNKLINTLTSWPLETSCLKGETAERGRIK